MGHKISLYSHRIKNNPKVTTRVVGGSQALIKQKGKH